MTTDGDDLKDGKARVRRVLIEPLEAMLALEKGMTRARHEQGLARLEAILSYMSDGDLEALRNGIEGACRTARSDRWPAKMSIEIAAAAISKPPESDSDMVRSFMRSSAGRMALAEGFHVELYLTLKDGKPPMTDAAYQMLRARAVEKSAELERARDRIRRGVARDGDSRIVEQWMRLDARARALVPLDVAGAAA
jgi:hypothetical protein